MAPNPPIGPTGKEKNCYEWGVYQDFGTSEESRVCNGGRSATGGVYSRCPSLEDCRRETWRLAGKTYLPTYAQTTAPTLGRPLISTPNIPQNVYNQSNTMPRVPVAMPQAQRSGMIPAPVMPSSEFPEAMQTPYALPPQVNQTPIFLPLEGEGPILRTIQNALQGAFGSMAWHVFSMTANVDFFRRKRRP